MFAKMDVFLIVIGLFFYGLGEAKGEIGPISLLPQTLEDIRSIPEVIVSKIEAIKSEMEAKQRAAEREVERAKEQADKYIISSSDAYSMLRGCCVGAGGAWAHDQKCVGNWDQGEAFYACAKSKDKDTYIRHKSGNLEKLNPRDFMR